MPERVFYKALNVIFDKFDCRIYHFLTKPNITDRLIPLKAHTPALMHDD
jgi:hypothetical protein